MKIDVLKIDFLVVDVLELDVFGARRKMVQDGTGKCNYLDDSVEYSRVQSKKRGGGVRGLRRIPTMIFKNICY